MNSQKRILGMIATDAREMATEAVMEEEEAFSRVFQVKVRVNEKQVRALAEFIKGLPDGSSGLNFYSFRGKDGEEIVADMMYPPLNHPGAIDFFFWVCSQQFGFWYGNHRGYVEPLYGVLDGKRFKGSDLLWQLAMRALKVKEDFFSPENLADLTSGQFAKLLSDDNGPVPFPDWEMRYRLTTGYGQDFLNQSDPKQLVAFSNTHSDRYQLERFVDKVSAISGFKGDYSHKKPLLLAMALANRPEKFLQLPVETVWPPIVDYHLMRLALRLGLVEADDQITTILILRAWCSKDIEAEIRANVYDAVSKLILLSDKPMSFVDHLMWSARKYCPEMEEPDCAKCKLQLVCAKRTELFQPILRTTNY